MRYSNEAVLEALRHAQYRQVPWPKRPRVFEYLLSLGLIETTRQRSTVASTYHAPVDIAVLTALGRAEFDRLARIADTPGWGDDRASTYQT